MVTRLLGLTMAASLIEAYCCPARLTYPSVKSLWVQKPTQKIIMTVYNIYSVDIVYFYNLSKCQCTAEQNVAQETIMAIYNCIYIQQLHISIPYQSVNAQKDTQKIIITMVDQ